MGRDEIIIIGAGQAGVSAALRLRAKGFEGGITLIGAEPEPPYQRPPLSKKYMTGEQPRERLYLKPFETYAAQGIKLMLGANVIAIHTDIKKVLVDDGTALPYSKLLFTTGARPRLLADEMRKGFTNIYPFRSFMDADALQKELVPGNHMLVVGGGYIGLETAAVARKKGMEVTLIEQAPRILGRVASPETSDYFRKLHQDNGVVIHEGAALLSIGGSGARASHAEVEGVGRIEFDVAVVGIGVLPNQELAEKAGLRVDNGITVDALCRTSNPDIFAAGDCASFLFKGRRIRLESVQNAISQAEHAADVMLGVEAGAYTPVPWFWSDQYETKLQIAGLNIGYDEVIARKGVKEGSFSVWYFRKGRFIAVDAMNDPRAYMSGKRWLETGIEPDRDVLNRPELDLKTAS